MHVGTEVVRGDLKPWLVGGYASHVQGPTPEAKVSHSECNKRHVPQLFVKALIVSGKFRVAERYTPSCERLSLFGCKGWGVIEVHPVKVETGEFGESGKLVDEVAGRVSREGLLSRTQLPLQKTGIYQNSVASQTHDEKGRQEEAPQPHAEPEPSWIVAHGAADFDRDESSVRPAGRQQLIMSRVHVLILRG